MITIRVDKLIRLALIAVIAMLAVNISPGSAEKLNLQPVTSSALEPSIFANAILWDQLNLSSNYSVSQDFNPSWDNWDVYAADDWNNDQTWVIKKISAQGGWTIDVNLLNASAIHWFIYSDNAGDPAGVPGDMNEFWSISLPPTDPQIVLGGDNQHNVILNLTTPINLPPGTWWLIIFPSLNYDNYGQWGWSGTLNAVWGQKGHLNNPGGGFGLPSGWNPGYYDCDYSFRLEGLLLSYMPLIRKP
ncbi:MAG: hypothetical protein WBV22_00655 [Anaerolineaceae bacterium]